MIILNGAIMTSNSYVNASAHLNEEEQENMPLLHIYSQEDSHCEAYIVANREALLKLKEAIDNAINTGRGSTGAFTSDGEGFDIKIICNNELWDSEFWKNISLPYTAEWRESIPINGVACPSEIWYKK